MVTLSGGHLSVDFASGAVPALLPFLSDEFDLSYTATAGLMLAVLVSSSLLQPLFGLWSDRRGAMWLLPGGVALAGIGTGLASVAPSYALVVALFFAAGVGIAAYHPEGAKFAAYASGRKRATACRTSTSAGTRVRARADPHHAAGDLARPRGGCSRWSPSWRSPSSSSACFPRSGVSWPTPARVAPQSARTTSGHGPALSWSGCNSRFALLAFVLCGSSRTGDGGEGRELALMLVSGAVERSSSGPSPTAWTTADARHADGSF